MYIRALTLLCISNWKNVDFCRNRSINSMKPKARTCYVCIVIRALCNGDLCIKKHLRSEDETEWEEGYASRNQADSEHKAKLHSTNWPQPLK